MRAAQNPNRIPAILGAVRRTWEKYPELRLTQLLAAAAGVQDPFYVEDGDLVRGLKRMLEDAPS